MVILIDLTWGSMAASRRSRITWPKDFGGAGLPYTYQAIFLEESARAETPNHIGVIGLGMAGPTIVAYGTDAQKARYPAKILSCEEIWCQGYSEPNSGSDLAALQTRAVKDGEYYVINGQKVWTSLAHVADWMMLPSIWFLIPSGLIASPASTADQACVTRTRSSQTTRTTTAQ